MDDGLDADTEVGYDEWYGEGCRVKGGSRVDEVFLVDDGRDS